MRTVLCETFVVGLRLVLLSNERSGGSLQILRISLTVGHGAFTRRISNRYVAGHLQKMVAVTSTPMFASARRCGEGKHRAGSRAVDLVILAARPPVPVQLMGRAGSDYWYAATFSIAAVPASCPARNLTLTAADLATLAADSCSVSR